MKKMKKVYVSLIADLLHAGHIKILKEAAKYGEVTVGLLTSSAIFELNDNAYLKYVQRLVVIENLEMVSKIIPQDTASYRSNLLNLKPDFVVHGDDWTIGGQAKYRLEVIDLLNKCCVGFLSVENDNPIECEMFNYLDELRESGDTNMWGATPYIQDKFGVSNKDSKLLLVKWMERGAS